MKKYEAQYYDILEDIKYHGHKELNKRTGVETIRIPHAIIQVDLQKEFPILKCKEVFWKSALDEILWIMQRQSANIGDLKPRIWDEWADENGSIGKAYGYQVSRTVVTHEGNYFPSQVHYVLDTLKNDPSDRRGVIDLWSVGDMGKMNLNPCCFVSVWNIIDGKLNCLLTQRSADYLVGVPFNTTQYSILTHLFARHIGVEVGQITHVMADCHVYCYPSHMNGMDLMLNRIEEMKEVSGDGIFGLKDEESIKASLIERSEPKFVIKTDETDFFNINPKDCDIEDYKHFPHIPFDVAV